MASGEEGAWTGRGEASLGRTKATWTTTEQPSSLPFLDTLPRNGPGYLAKARMYPVYTEVGGHVISSRRSPAL